MPQPDSDPPSLGDVARRANVSRMTASRILRGRPGHKPDTVKRVQKAAAALGYQPNPHVSAAMEQVRRTRPTEYVETLAFLHLGSLRELLQSRHGKRLYEGILDRAGELGYRIEPHPLPNSASQAGALTRVLQSRGIRGMILSSIGQPGPLPYLAIKHFCVTSMGPTILEPALVRVTSDAYARSELAIQKALAAGYQRIAGIIDQGAEISTNHRLLAPFPVYELLHGSADTRIIARIQDTHLPEARIDEQLAQFLKEHRPQVVISPRRAIYYSLRRLNLRIPHDVAFIHTNWTAQGSVPLGLAGVDQQSRRQGQALVDVVSARLHRGEFGPANNPRDVHIPPIWCDGASAP